MCYAIGFDTRDWELCLRDVISFKFLHNALGLLLFSDIRFESADRDA